MVASGAPGPSSAAPPAVVVASSALALPICQSYAAPAAAQSTGLGGRIPAAAAAASEDPATFAQGAQGARAGEGGGG